MSQIAAESHDLVTMNLTWLMSNTNWVSDQAVVDSHISRATASAVQMTRRRSIDTHRLLTVSQNLHQTTNHYLAL